jgi:hypothetical protein
MKQIEHLEQLDSPAAALAKALDSYGAWVNCHSGRGIDEAVRGESGASLLHAVAEIRRHHCPGATQLMTNLLLDHTRLSTLLFEHQLKLVRGQRSEPMINSEVFASLVQRQTATIAAMRATCGTQRALCILTGTPAKNAARQFAGRPASAGDTGQPAS